MPKNSRRSHNNNPEGRNQYSSDWMGTVRDRPVTTAAAAAGAVAAGVFLWSKRNEISDQIGRLSDQISDWAEDMRSSRSSNSDRELALTGGPNESSAVESSRATAKRGTRSNGTGRSSSATTGTQSNQTTGGRSEGDNQTL